MNLWVKNQVAKKSCFQCTSAGCGSCTKMRGPGKCARCWVEGIPCSPSNVVSGDAVTKMVKSHGSDPRPRSKIAASSAEAGPSSHATTATTAADDSPSPGAAAHLKNNSVSLDSHLPSGSPQSQS